MRIAAERYRVLGVPRTASARAFPAPNTIATRGATHSAASASCHPPSPFDARTPAPAPTDRPCASCRQPSPRSVYEIDPARVGITLANNRSRPIVHHASRLPRSNRESEDASRAEIPVPAPSATPPMTPPTRTPAFNSPLVAADAPVCPNPLNAPPISQRESVVIGPKNPPSATAWPVQAVLVGCSDDSAAA